MGINSGPILCPLWTKVRDILGDVGDSYSLQRPILYTVFLFRRYWPLKLSLSCEIVGKWFLGPRFFGGRYTPDSDIHFQMALTFEHMASFGCVPFSELGG